LQCRWQSIEEVHGWATTFLQDALNCFEAIGLDTVEPMILSESAKKQMMCSLQRKANNNTHANFRSHRNFKSGGSIGKCSTHSSHTIELVAGIDLKFLT
jgi:hypothetical protein